MQYYSKTADNQLKPAPMVLEINGRIVTAPTAAQYAAKGYYPYNPAVPESREGYTHRVSDYEVVDGAWVPVYEYDPVPATAHRYSKLKLYGALAQANLWEPLKSWLETQEVNGLNAWTAFQMAQDLTSDNELFARYLSAAQLALGATDEQVAAILAAAEADA